MLNVIMLSVVAPNGLARDRLVPPGVNKKCVIRGAGLLVKNDGTKRVREQVNSIGASPDQKVNKAEEPTSLSLNIGIELRCASPLMAEPIFASVVKKLTMRLIYRYLRAVDCSRHICLQKIDFNKTEVPVEAQSWLPGQ
jgi:hypothetical protein